MFFFSKKPLIFSRFHFSCGSIFFQGGGGGGVQLLFLWVPIELMIFKRERSRPPVSLQDPCVGYQGQIMTKTGMTFFLYMQQALKPALKMLLVEKNNLEIAMEGRISNFLIKWEKINDNQLVLSLIKHWYKMEFLE